MMYLGFWIGGNEFSLLRPLEFVPIENTTPAQTREYDKLSALLKGGYHVTKGSGDEYLLIAMQQMKDLVEFNPVQRRERVNEIIGSPPPQDYDLATWLKLCQTPKLLPKSNTNNNAVSTSRKRNAPENAVESYILPKYPKQNTSNASTTVTGVSVAPALPCTKQVSTAAKPSSTGNLSADTHKRSSGTTIVLKTREEVEQSFRHSQKTILRTVEFLRRTNSKRATNDLMGQLKKLQRHVPDMCWQFIVHYKVGYVLKPAKEILKIRGMSVDIISELKQAIKVRYKESKEEYPHDLDLAWLHDAELNESSATMDKIRSTPKPMREDNVKQIPPSRPSGESKKKSPTIDKKRNVSKTKRDNTVKKIPLSRPSGEAKKKSPTIDKKRDVHKTKRDDATVKQTLPTLATSGSPEHKKGGAKYGKLKDEKTMREWLLTSQIPKATADKLVQHGARCIADVKTLVVECPSVLDDFPTLDRWKLKKAVDLLR
jgi:hypothetical protein